MPNRKFFDFMTSNGKWNKNRISLLDKGFGEIFFENKQLNKMEITIISLTLRLKKISALNEEQRKEMGVSVKNSNILVQMLGRMKYFATLSLSLSLSLRTAHI